jgi:hypothetical protein
MFDFSKKSEGGNQKVDFPLGIAVDNVVLRNIEVNRNILGLQFNFQRVLNGTIAFLSDTLLPPKQEWFTEDKQIGDKLLSAEEQYNLQIRVFSGYVRHLLTNCGLDNNDLAKVPPSEDLKEYLIKFCEIINPIIERKRIPVYLKTVVDKQGYIKLPKFRGKGVASPMDAGKPAFEYSEYELELIQGSRKEGVEEVTQAGDNTPKATTGTGMDF